MRTFQPTPISRSYHRHIARSPVAPLPRRLFLTPENVAKLSKRNNKKKKGMLALLIAAHNEELVLGNTLRSAIKAGMNPLHIYVVDDSSSDGTSKIAKKILPASNVMKVQRSGKGLAIDKAAKRFELTSNYRWIHIADADGAFAPGYFRIFRRELRSEYNAATGYIRSLPGKRVSEYRVFEYTVGMEIHRRMQTLFNVVPVIPGPTSCFRADVFDKVNFDNKSLTEDFDVTMQLHRLGMGKIQFIPKAIAYTQDPISLRDYTTQIARWNRGGLQSMLRYRMGRSLTRVDAYLTYQILQNLLFFAIYLIWVPYVTIVQQQPGAIAAAFIADVVVTYVITWLAAARTKRWDIISAFPHIYFLRWVSLAVFLKSFFEVIVLKQYRHTDGLWGERSARYRWKFN